MELTKYGQTEILAHIKHDLRQIPAGKTYGNESVDLALTRTNYSLINRGKTAKEVNKYRKDFEANIFKYNRKNLVHAVELVIQCPDDCPEEQHNAFFNTAFNWYCGNYLPAGKDCVFVAEVHRDEHKFITTSDGKKDISKEHLHIAFVPAVPAGEKHPDFTYRLNADLLTKKKILKEMHPSLQKALDDAGIKATVVNKKNDGKTIPLTVKQLKEITNKTGIVIDHSLTVEELAYILAQNIELTKSLEIKNERIEKLVNVVKDKTSTINILTQENNTIKVDPEKELLKSKLHERDLDLSKTFTKINAQDKELSALKEELKNKNLELQQLQEKVVDLENHNKTINHTPKEEKVWGETSSWGSSSNWGTSTKTIEEEKTW